MSLRDDAAADAPAAWFDTDGLAQMVIYTRPSRELGEPEVVTEIPAVIHYGENPQDAGHYQSAGRAQAAVLTARISAVSITDPRRDGDTLTIAGVIWRVRKIRSGDALGIAWELECTRAEQSVRRGRE
jgi:hypothetical protein